MVYSIAICRFLLIVYRKCFMSQLLFGPNVIQSINKTKRMDHYAVLNSGRCICQLNMLTYRCCHTTQTLRYHLKTKSVVKCHTYIYIYRYIYIYTYICPNASIFQVNTDKWYIFYLLSANRTLISYVSFKIDETDRWWLKSALTMYKLYLINAQDIRYLGLRRT